MKRKKIKIDWTQRRLYLAGIDAAGIILYTVYDVYSRSLRWYGGGLTDRERAYAQTRCIRLKLVADDMSNLTQRLRKTVNNHAR